MIETKIKGILGGTLRVIHFVGMVIIYLLVGKHLAKKQSRDLIWIRIILGAVVTSFIILILFSIFNVLWTCNLHESKRKTFFDTFSFGGILFFTIIGAGLSIGLQYAKESLMRRYPDVMI